MSIQVLMPALSPTMTEGTIVKWLKQVGDSIESGDVLCEIETDKATMEVEAVDEGKITKLLVDEGTLSIPINSVIAILNGSDGSDDIEEVKEVISEYENKKNTNFESDNYNQSIDKIKDEKMILKTDGNKKIKASPFVKKLSKEKKIDLNNIQGSGPDKRIIKRDLEKINYQENNINHGEKPSSMRKIIAERTTLTKQTVPHFYLTIESNVDKLLKMRKKINNDSEIKISINDILVKGLALAQKMNPKTNVSWIDGLVVKSKKIDVAIAVALDEGLITPIIKNADLKGLIEISKEIKYLAKKAKKGKLLPEEYNGGSISISNLGKFGISEFSAIINPPQSSILAVGEIKRVPSVVNDEIKVANILKSTLSADHRVLDGAVAGKLLKDFNDIIEDPFSLWINSSDMVIL